MAIGFFVIGLAALFTATEAADDDGVSMEVRADRDDPVYRCGETATFSIVVRDGEKAVTEGDVAVTLSLDGGRTIAEKTVALGPEPSSVSGTLEDPGFLLCTASVRIGGEERRAYQAAGFEPERIETTAVVPDDFDEFWAKGRARVDALPMDLRLVRIPRFSDEKQETFKISLININDTRIYGWLSVPKGRKPPYPAFVSVPGAGVGAPYKPITTESEAGALSLVMGVHTHDLGLPVEDYEALAAGPLRHYGHEEVPDPEGYFFYRAILGIDRAVRYLISRPDWDGEHLAYYGSSQGGGMGLTLAGLNPEFNSVAVNVPARCDRNAWRAGRGNRRPRGDSEEEREKFAKAAEYFDAVNFARKIRCPVVMSVGFRDRSCPPSSVYAAFNVIQAPKRIFHGPNSGHVFIPSFGEYFDQWMSSHLGRAEPLPPKHE